MAYPYDSKILAKIGLSEFDAIDFLEKQEDFVASLSEKQHDVLHKALPSWEDAAKAIDPQMTADDLKDFVARRSPKLAAYPVMAFIFPGHRHHIVEAGDKKSTPLPSTPTPSDSE